MNWTWWSHARCVVVNPVLSVFTLNIYRDSQHVWYWWSHARWLVNIVLSVLNICDSRFGHGMQTWTWWSSRLRESAVLRISSKMIIEHILSITHNRGSIVWGISLSSLARCSHNELEAGWPITGVMAAAPRMKTTWAESLIWTIGMSRSNKEMKVWGKCKKKKCRGEFRVRTSLKKVETWVDGFL